MQKYTIIGIADTKNEKISKKMEKDLKKDYEDAVSAYVRAFSKQMNMRFGGWIGDEVGGMADFDDYYSLDFADVKRCVDEGYEWDEVLEWYDYCVEAGMYGIATPNLKSWMMGCPHLNGPEMERIRAASRRVEEAKAALEAEIRELTQKEKKTAHKPWECCF